METLDGARLITCILPKGVALPVLEALKTEKGIVSANINYARGTGRITPRSHREQLSETEKEVLVVVVPRERKEELFDFIREQARIDRPHGGIMYQTVLTTATPFQLPELPEEG